MDGKLSGRALDALINGSLQYEIEVLEVESDLLKQENERLREGIEWIASQLELDWNEARFILMGIKDIVDALLKGGE
jgi:hypothetical protein